MSTKALYYPYIHIRDVNWLKATLLVFPQVRRMLPFSGLAPDDDPELAAFTEWHNDREPFLVPANLSSERVIAAQDRLASRLEADSRDPEFVAVYGADAAARIPVMDPFGFQIHVEKLSESLTRALSGSRLAWVPRTREPYDYSSAYIQLHPRVGEAVMSTLAVNCAVSEGLSIVGDARSGPLHRCLIEKDAAGIYDAWLRPSADSAAPPSATAGELFEAFVALKCDVREVTPEALAELQRERDAIDALMNNLRQHALELPQMDTGTEREELFRAASDRIVREWCADRANMSKFWRNFFGEGLVDTTAKFLETVADKVLVGTLAGGAAIGVAADASAAQMASAGLIGGGAGLVVGMIVHAGKSAVATSTAERTSQYRYLSMMEDAGVIFRTDTLGIQQ
jgi:hypothetical protein